MPIIVVMAVGVCQMLRFYRCSQEGLLSCSAFQQLVVMKVAVNILKLDKHKNQLNCNFTIVISGGDDFLRHHPHWVEGQCSHEST